MARVWKDRIVEKPRTFRSQNNADGTITLIPAPGTIIQEGTPVNAVNMNGIENDIKKASRMTDTITGSIYAWGIENGQIFVEEVAE